MHHKTCRGDNARGNHEVVHDGHSDVSGRASPSHVAKNRDLGLRFFRDFGALCYNLIHRAGTDALVTVSHGVHGVHFPSNFRYMGWKQLKQAKQLTAGKYSKNAGFPLTR
jgi:hypothetical protein